MKVFLALVCCLVVCSLLTAGTGYARDYYLSPSGNDTNPATSNQPWQTIAKVNAADLEPGDRVLFEGGKKFTGTITLDANDGGSTSNKVELSSYGEGRATIDGGNESALVSRGCSHLRIANLTFVGAGRKTGNTQIGVLVAEGDDILVDQIEMSGFQKSGFSFAGVHDGRATNIYAHDNGADGISVGAAAWGPNDRWSERIYIGYCVAENNPGDPTNLDNHSGSGIVVGGVHGCIIEYCEAMNNGWDMPWRGRESNGPVGIWAWNADHVTIQFCVSHDNKSTGGDGGGFDLDGGVTNSILQYNYSYHNMGPGLFMCQYYPAPTWKDNIIRYNISINDGYMNNCSGINIGGYELMSDAEVYNNTIYNMLGGAVGIGGNPLPPRIRFRNNIFVTGKGQMIRGDASLARFEGNLYWVIDPEGTVAGGYKTLEEWAKATGQEMVDGKLIGLWADPLLINADTMPRIRPKDLAKLAAYNLQSGSPCVGAGLPIADNGGRDFWGNKVPTEGKPTIGAFQQP